MLIIERSRPIHASRCYEGWPDRMSRESAASQGLRRTLFGRSRVRRTREHHRQPVLPSRKTQFRYDPQGRMLTLPDARGITFLTNEYDVAGRVSSQQTQVGGASQQGLRRNGATLLRSPGL